METKSHELWERKKQTNCPRSVDVYKRQEPKQPEQVEELQQPEKLVQLEEPTQPEKSVQPEVHTQPENVSLQDMRRLMSEFSKTIIESISKRME